MHIKQDLRDFKRLEEILKIFLEEGWGYYLHRAKLHYHLPFLQRWRPHFPFKDNEEQAVRLRKAFERLGPTFIKLGQLLSLRPDLVPEEFCKEFEKLQDHVPTFPLSQAIKIIEEDFGQPIHKIFRKFESKPVAAASMAQVYHAELKNGKEVAVKVQRPNVKEIIDADLDLLFFLAHQLEKHFPTLRKNRPVDIVREFALWTRKELNFDIEARSALRLKEELKNNQNVRVPEVYKEYSSRRVLTLEYVDGVKINNFAALKKMHLNRKKIALTYFISILEQAFIHGFFHADPHPANIFVQKDGKLVYLDFGIMGELNYEDRLKIIHFITSIPEKDPEKSFQIVLSLAHEVDPSNLDEYKDEVISIMSEVYSSNLSEVSFGQAIYRVVTLGAQYGITYDTNHVMMAKAVYQGEGLGRELDPNFKVAEGLNQFADKYLRKEFSPVNWLQKAKKTVAEHSDLLLDLPEHVLRIMEKLEKEEKPAALNTTRLEELEKELLRIERRRGLLSASVILLFGAALLFYMEGQKTLFSLPLSYLLLGLAAILLIYMIFKKEDKEVEKWRRP